MPRIDGARLKFFREKRGWTQERLAAESHIDKGTISRRERDGKVGLASAHTVEQLCKAMKIDRAVLSGEAPLPDEATRHADRPKGEIRFKMHDQNRNALGLVSLRYGISQDVVLAMAPLLFFIAAESSLAERRSACAAAEAALTAVQEAIERLPANPSTYDGKSEKAIDVEMASIKRRDLFALPNQGGDVFGVQYDQNYDYGTDNPFVNFLRDALAKVVPQNDDTKFRLAEVDDLYPGYLPAYHVCRDEALNIVRNNAKAARGILTGVVPLHEMAKELSGQATPERREAWALERVQKADQEIAERIANLPEFHP